MTTSTRTNPNTDLFSRLSPKRKAELVTNYYSANELLNISADTIKRIIKEVGEPIPHTRNKRLRIRGVGNEWNSTITDITLYKGNLFVAIYVQYFNTDTTDVVPFAEFFRSGTYKGSVKYTDYHGNAQTAYYNYHDLDKARLMRSICAEYINRKYYQTNND